jgi:hypothetical protein
MGSDRSERSFRFFLQFRRIPFSRPLAGPTVANRRILLATRSADWELYDSILRPTPPYTEVCRYILRGPPHIRRTISREEDFMWPPARGGKTAWIRWLFIIGEPNHFIFRFGKTFFSVQLRIQTLASKYTHIIHPTLLTDQIINKEDAGVYF